MSNVMAEQGKAVEKIYENYADLLFRIAFANLLNQQDAEDAVSEVFIKYMTNTPLFNDESHEKAWFIRVLINQCHDIRRKSSLRTYTPLEQMVEKPKDEEQELGVLEKVMSLPEKCKTVILLFHFEDFSIEEIAISLKAGISAIKMRLSRCRELLKKEIQKGE